MGDDTDSFGREIHAAASSGGAGLLSPEWRGRVTDLGGDVLRAFWAEAVEYARWEIGQYAPWREQDEPVMADGYDAEGVVQAAFERLMCRETESVPIIYSADDVRRELRSGIKHRVRWLHERSETRLAVGEWDVLRPTPNGERRSIFDYLPSGTGKPDEELAQKERERSLKEFKERFEGTLGRVADDREREQGRKAGETPGETPALPARTGSPKLEIQNLTRDGATARREEIRNPNERLVKAREELVEVFRGMWRGRRRRDVAKALGTSTEHQVKMIGHQAKGGSASLFSHKFG